MMRMTKCGRRSNICDSNIHRIMLYIIFILCSALHNVGAIPIRRRMREQHESDSEDEEDAVDVAYTSIQASLDKLRATARAEAAAEDGLPADHYDRFRRTPDEDFYKKPVRCAAHVVGIADPYKKGKRASGLFNVSKRTGVCA